MKDEKSTAQITAPINYKVVNQPGTGTPCSFQRVVAKIQRNDKCPCGSGKKFKNCHKTEESLIRIAQAVHQAKMKANAISGPSLGD